MKPRIHAAFRFLEHIFHIYITFRKFRSYLHWYDLRLALLFLESRSKLYTYLLVQPSQIIQSCMYIEYYRTFLIHVSDLLLTITIDDKCENIKVDEAKSNIQFQKKKKSFTCFRVTWLSKAI